MGPVAQWIEQYRPKVLVEGSTPFRIATKIKEDTMKKISLLFFLVALTLLIVGCQEVLLKVTIDPMNGSEATVVELKKGSYLDVPANPVLENYNFVGWYIGDNLVDFNLPIESNTTIIAKWAAITYQVTFITYGESNPVQIVQQGQVATKPEDPVKAHNAFVHWETNGAAYDFSTPVTKDLVLYAIYTPIVYTIYFETSGGTEVATQQVNSGRYLSKPADPFKAHHLFMGWYLGETLFDFDNPVTNNLVLYAKWNEVQYTEYYRGIEGLTGDNLITFLNILLKQMTGRPYEIGNAALQVTDRNPNNSNQLIEFYTGASYTATWDNGRTWNKEHVWPQSLLSSEAKNGVVNVASDLHNLKPSNPSINTSRSNKWYGPMTTSVSYFPTRTAIHGDIARILFYMDVRYDILSLVNLSGNQVPNTYQMGDLATLLLWHIQDPVDDFERNRNNVLFGYQGNRNPFIDYPELVSIIYYS